MYSYFHFFASYSTFIFCNIGALQNLQLWRLKCHHLAGFLIMVAKIPLAGNARSALQKAA